MMNDYSQSRKRLKLTVPPSDRYTCSWWLCNEAFYDSSQLMSHLISHVQPFEFSGSVSCLWKNCDLPSLAVMTYEESIRHLSHHVHHLHLKMLGNEFLKTKTSAMCSLNSSKVNSVTQDFSSPFKCCWLNCEFATNIVSEFYIHVANHADLFAPGNSKTRHCSCLWLGCSKSFNSKTHLKEHLRSHTSEKAIACCVCGGTFANREKLLLHVERQVSSNGSEENICCFCHKTFSSNSLLLQHVYHHVNHYLCPFCGFTVRAPSDLKRHIFHKHQAQKPFVCGDDDCIACFKTEFDLKRHVSDVHKKESKFDCFVENCHFSCIHFAKLVTHLKQEHKDISQPLPQYACHLCSSRFNTRTPLTQHLKKLHNIQYAEGMGRFRYILDEDGCYRMQVERVNQLKDVFFSTLEPMSNTEGFVAENVLSGHGSTQAEFNSNCYYSHDGVHYMEKKPKDSNPVVLILPREAETNDNFHAFSYAGS